MIREAQEELGLINIKPLKYEYKRFFGKQNYFIQRYSVQIDVKIKDFKIQTEEVAQVKWWSKQKIKQSLSNNPDIFMKNLIGFLKYLAKI